MEKFYIAPLNYSEIIEISKRKCSLNYRKLEKEIYIPEPAKRHGRCAARPAAAWLHPFLKPILQPGFFCKKPL